MVGLYKNVGKMVSMAYQPFHATEGNSAETYGLCMTGYGTTHRERLCQQVRCPDCDIDLAAGLLETHRQIQHGVGKGDLGGTPPHPLPQWHSLIHIRFINLWGLGKWRAPWWTALFGTQVGLPSRYTSHTVTCGT